MTLATSGLSTISDTASCSGGVSAAPRGVAMTSAIIWPRRSPAWCAAWWMALSSLGAEALMSFVILRSTTATTSLMPCSAKSFTVVSSISMPDGVAYFIIMSMKPCTWLTMPWIWRANESRLLLDSEEKSKHIFWKSEALPVALAASHDANAKVSGAAGCPDLTACSAAVEPEPSDAARPPMRWWRISFDVSEWKSELRLCVRWCCLAW
mmetsp:Transcript_71778/g.185142  ORF Transcript_71778/g.185142 Transcript_71778/m.185142 type:complete len:209 (+) Transcript_71778:1358-1984(+)